MGGGLLNITAHGNGNVILTGNPKKTFFKTTYCHYTNFGIQKFRVDYEGSKTINLNEKTHYDFKIPRNADLLMDTFLAIKLPNIWSTIVYNNKCKKWIPYSFQWVENLGTQIIDEIQFTIGGTTLQRVSGEYLTTLVQREFTKTKKGLYNKMIGNINELKNPSKFIEETRGIYPDNYVNYTRNPLTPENDFDTSWFRYGDNYPHVIRFDKHGNVPNKPQPVPQPSIRGRYLYIPMNIWYMLSSKLAFPMVALQYNELHIKVSLRPVREWFTINNVSATTDEACNGPDQRIRPNFSDPKHSLHRFIHPTPQIKSTVVNDVEDEAYVNLNTEDLVWEDTRNIWKSDVHLICSYVFLSDDERRNFAKQEQVYLFKSIHEYKFLGLHESNTVKLDALGMVSSYTFFFRRSDAYKRNEWSNYSNYEYNQVNPFTQGVISTPYFAPRNNGDGVFDRFFYTPEFNEKYDKNILKTFAILLDGKYRETDQIDGVYNYLEKYLKTAGDAPDGLYVYNFCLNSDPFVYQPSGALNMSKFKDIQFEFTILRPPENPNAQVLTSCDPETGDIVAIQETANSIFNYTYDLYVFEERFNQVIFSNGNCGLLYAR